MKPTKNKYHCKDCGGKIKMLFQTEKEANTFMKFNSADIEEEAGYGPKRAYECISCGGWHVTSKKDNLYRKSKTENLLEQYEKEKEIKASLVKKREPQTVKEKEKRVGEIENQIKNIAQDAREIKVQAWIDQLKKQIAELPQTEDSQKEIKELRQEIERIGIARNNLGVKKISKQRKEYLDEEGIEEWKNWHEKLNNASGMPTELS
jgi:flagellar biosynthesis GTPase FlhF